MGCALIFKSTLLDNLCGTLNFYLARSMHIEVCFLEIALIYFNGLSYVLAAEHVPKHAHTQVDNSWE